MQCQIHKSGHIVRQIFYAVTRDNIIYKVMGETSLWQLKVKDLSLLLYVLRGRGGEDPSVLIKHANSCVS